MEFFWRLEKSIIIHNLHLIAIFCTDIEYSAFKDIILWCLKIIKGI